MDGDEKRSGGTALCDDATGGTDAEAAASGDVAPASAAGSAESESDEDVTAAADSIDQVEAGDEAEAPEAVTRAVEADGTSAEPEEGEPASAASASVEPEEGESDADEPAACATSDDAVPDGSLSDGSVPDGLSDGSVSDGSVSDGLPDGSEPDTASSDDVGAPVGEDAADGSEPAAAAAAPAVRRRRLRPYLRRGAVALAVAGFVALGVGAFAWATPSPEAADQRFVEAAQSQGHIVAPGEQQTLVVSAARKICDRRVIHDTDQERRATALSTDEIAAVGTAFGADTRDFTMLALKTYCSS